MFRLTWNTRNIAETNLAERVFESNVAKGLIAKHDGKVVNEFRKSHGSITFEQKKTGIERVMKEAPWDNS